MTRLNKIPANQDSELFFSLPDQYAPLMSPILGLTQSGMDNLEPPHDSGKVRSIDSVLKHVHTAKQIP